MQKFKSLKLAEILKLVKCCLIGIVATLIGTVVFAFVLKFAMLSSSWIGYINNLIKLFSIFIMVMCIKKNNEGNLLIKSIFCGVVYAMISFVIFSILNGFFALDLSFVYDLLFCVVVSAVSAVIINILNRKNV